MRSLVACSLSIRGFRNLLHVDIELGDRFNVISGDNGQGKTNLIECVYVLATSRSFRTSKLSDLVAHGADVASVRGRMREGDEEREQILGVRGGTRSVLVDGKRPKTLAAYAVHSPTVVFHPGAITLSSGAGAERRKLLDRVALYLSPYSLVEAESYAKALRGRQKALDLRGESARDLDGWEDLCVRHGLALRGARATAAELVGPAAERAFGRIGAETSTLVVRYVSGAPSDAEAFRSELVRNRARDRARRAASTGPHRDDLALELSGKPVRSMASQGQQRAVVLALELAEIEVVAGVRGVHPILLLDDVSSELDRSRLMALLLALREGQGQVLLTTTRPELLDFPGSSGPDFRFDFRVVGGQIGRA